MLRIGRTWPRKAAKHAPPKPEAPVEISWNWPSRDVSQSLNPSGVGDLEDDYDDYDD